MREKPAKFGAVDAIDSPIAVFSPAPPRLRQPSPAARRRALTMRPTA